MHCRPCSQIRKAQITMIGLGRHNLHLLTLLWGPSKTCGRGERSVFSLTYSNGVASRRHALSLAPSLSFNLQVQRRCKC